MKKVLTVLATIAIAAALSTFSFAQAQDQSTTQQPSAQQPTTQQPADQPPTSQPGTPSQDSSTMQADQGTSFTGLIVKANGKYILNVNATSYQLDDQDKAKQFVGQNVKVSGTLDSSTSTIHVADISPMS